MPLTESEVAAIAERTASLVLAKILPALDVEAITDRVAKKLKTAPAPQVIQITEAARRAGFGSNVAFLRWAAKVGVRSLNHAKGRYDVSALNRAIERAGRVR